MPKMLERRFNLKVSEAAFLYYQEQAKKRNMMPGALLAKFLDVVAANPSYMPNILDDEDKPPRHRSQGLRRYRGTGMGR